MALGAFLAGVLLAESEYRRELETDIEPFKGLLLGLFFIAVGMSIDFAVVIAQPLLIAADRGRLPGCSRRRALGAWRARCRCRSRAAGLHHPARAGRRVRLRRLPDRGAGRRDLAAECRRSWSRAVAISMLLTPLLLVAADRWWMPRLAPAASARSTRLKEPQHAPVIIAGFGRYGQIVGRMLFANGVRPTVLDHDAEQIEACAASAGGVFYGDATRLDLLRTAGADKARVIVVAIDDIEQSSSCVKMIRAQLPQRGDRRARAQRPALLRAAASSA